MTLSMVTKIFNFFIKIFAIFLVVATSYILAIFLVPEFADTYGDKNFNDMIRDFKEKSLQISAP